MSFWDSSCGVSLAVSEVTWFGLLYKLLFAVCPHIRHHDDGKERWPEVRSAARGAGGQRPRANLREEAARSSAGAGSAAGSAGRGTARE